MWLEDSSGQVQLNGQSGYPDTTTPSTLTYALLGQPSHGTISNFNASTGTFTYTPNPGFLGIGFVSVPGDGDRAADNARDHGQQSRAP